MDVLGAVGSFASLANSNYSHQLGREDLQFSNDLALSNWYKQNDYNSPANHMNRLKSAGLNPNLVTGTIGQGQSAIGSLGQPTHDAASPLPIAEGVADYALAKENLSIQKSVADSEIRVNDATAKEIQARTPGYKQDQDIKDKKEQRDQNEEKRRLEEHAHLKTMWQFEETLRGLDVDNALFDYFHRDSKYYQQQSENAHRLRMNEVEYQQASLELNFALRTFNNRVKMIESQTEYAELSNNQLRAEIQILLGDFARIAPLQEYIGQNDDGTFYVKEGKEDELLLHLRLLGMNDNNKNQYGRKFIQLIKNWAVKRATGLDPKQLGFDK